MLASPVASPAHDVGAKLVSLIQKRTNFIDAQAMAGIDRTSLMTAQCAALCSEIAQEPIIDEVSATTITLECS